MRSTCFFALVLVLLSGPALSQEPEVTQARHPVWLEPCPEADSSDAEVLKARIDCLERRSEAMADSQNLLLQNMFLLLEEQFLNEPAKIVERIPAAEFYTGRFEPGVVNCASPLMDKAGFVIVGAKLSNWTIRQLNGETAPSQCVGNGPFSRSRSEGCYVNRTWFDWYTRRATSEGWPMNEAALCQNEAEEHIEETLVNYQLLINSDFSVWLDGDRLLYFREAHCRNEERRFFLHVFPVDLDDLPDDRKQYGFDNLDFDISQARLGSISCAAVRPLPDYPVAGIRTGQFTRGLNSGRIWAGTFSFTGDPVPGS